MKKILFKTCCTALISLMSVSAFASIDYCTDHSCWFWTLTKSPNKTLYFHCKVADGVTHIEFENHNVLVSGFVTGTGPKAGTLTLDGREEVAKLYTSYFEVKDDPNRNRFDPKTVVFKADGKVKCDLSKGGRTVVFDN